MISRQACGTDEPRTGGAGFAFAVYAIGLILVAFAGFVSFPRIQSGIFFSWDSATYVANAKEYFASHNVTGLIASYTQSLGNLAYTLNFNLLPEARLAYFGGQIHPAAMYLIASLMFFTVTYLMALVVMGLGPLLGLVSGVTMVALTMPFTSPPIYSDIFWWHSPYAIPSVYMYCTLLVTLSAIGACRLPGTLLSAFLLVLEVIWILVAGAKGGVLIIASAALFAVPIITSSASMRIVALRSLAGLAALSFLVLPSVFDYIRGLYAYTGNMLLFSQLQMSAAVDFGALFKTVFPSFEISYALSAAKVWVGYQIGYPLAILSTIGIVWTIFRPPTPVARHFAVAMIAVAPFLLLFTYGMAIGSAMYPLFVIFAIIGLAALAQWVGGQSRSWTK